MQKLVKLFTNSLYGVQIRKKINDSYYCKSEQWMKTENDENILAYWKLPNGKYNEKMKKDDGLHDDECDSKKTLPVHPGAFILKISKRFVNDFIREINGFYIINIYIYMTQMPIHSVLKRNFGMCWTKLNWLKKIYVKVKKHYKSGGIFKGLFLAPKIQYCLIIANFGILQKHKILKRFNDSKRLLDRSQYFKRIEGIKTSALLRKSWKKSFVSGIIIPTKTRNCNEYISKRMYKKYNILVKENEKLETSVNFLRREASNEFGYMLLDFKEEAGLIVTIRLLYFLFSVIFFSFC